MPIKAEGQATEWREIDRWSDGVGWLAHPEEGMQRASHAIADGDDVWLVDPVDADGIDDLFAEFGTVAGVVLLLSRHKRDAEAIANRHDVAVHVPDIMRGVEADLDAPVERLHRQLADTEYAIHELVNNRMWQETFLYGEDSGTLVVPEALGTVDYFRSSGERVGVHPMLRMKPPKTLTRLSPERLLVGHGEGVHDNTETLIEEAVAQSRRGAPGVYAKMVKSLVLG
jgi:hypothetical protein